MNQIPKNTFISYFQKSVDEMAEHILTFSHVNDEDYPNPKDKFPWKIKDLRENSYKCHNFRYIVTNGKRFIHP